MAHQETEFVRIKRAVEAQKQKKIQGEARIESLNEEQGRLLASASELIGKPVESGEELAKEAELRKESIQDAIVEMRKILESEGVDY